MRRSSALLILILLTAGSGALGEESAQSAEEPEAAEGLTEERENQSYAAGYSFGKSLSQGLVELSEEQILAGVSDGLAGQGRMGDDELRVLAQQLMNEMRRRRIDAQSAQAADNKAAGEAFLAANKERPEVVTLPSGLQYEVLTAGTGPKPLAEDTVKIHLHGTLLDGTVFDSSVERGQPAALRAASSIPGLAEAIPLMEVGSKWKLYVPYELGYGEKARGSNIPAAATLIYEAELLSIEPQADDEPGDQP